MIFSFWILSSNTLAGSSFGSCGTSLPSNACFRIDICNWSKRLIVYSTFFKIWLYFSKKTSSLFKRIFWWFIGISGIGILLFENFSKLTSSRLEKTIKYTIEKYEPRARIANITVKAKEEENAYEVIIVYLPDNDIQETTLEVYSERT